MRYIGSLSEIAKAQKFSFILNQEEIPHQVDYSEETDRHDVWVHDEDQLKKTQLLLKKFKQDPEGKEFQHYELQLDQLKQETLEKIRQAQAVVRIHSQDTVKKPKRLPLGKITTFILVLCVSLFLWENITTPTYAIPSNGEGVISNTVAQKNLLFDYPQKFEHLDKLLKIYGMEALTRADLPNEGVFLLNKFEKQEFWLGYYPVWVDYFHNTPPFSPPTPWFEKIKIGEYWRLFTPALLHGNLLHIFMNLFILLIVGPQIENKIGSFRYLILILFSGLSSNMVQYLMSGPFFMGISGVLCGMLAFIATRQRKAPWENYLLQPTTVKFFTFSILAIAALQMVAFFSQITGYSGFSLGIANSAHIVGGLSGILLAQFPFFSWKNSL